MSAHPRFAVVGHPNKGKSSIVSTLALKLTPDERERVHHRDTENLEAYEYFLRGRDQALRDTPEANAQARVMLEKAIELAEAYVNLSADDGYTLAAVTSANAINATVNKRTLTLAMPFDKLFGKIGNDFGIR